MGEPLQNRSIKNPTYSFKNKGFFCTIYEYNGVQYAVLDTIVFLFFFFLRKVIYPFKDCMLLQGFLWAY